MTCPALVLCPVILKQHSQGWTVRKVQPKFFNFVICNPCQSSPSLTILVPLWFIIISLPFFYLCKVLFSGFLQFNGNFVDGQNNSKYLDCATLNISPSPPFIFTVKLVQGKMLQANKILHRFSRSRSLLDIRANFPVYKCCVRIINKRHCRSVLGRWSF